MNSQPLASDFKMSQNEWTWPTESHTNSKNEYLQTRKNLERMRTYVKTILQNGFWHQESGFHDVERMESANHLAWIAKYCTNHAFVASMLNTLDELTCETL